MRQLFYVSRQSPLGYTYRILSTYGISASEWSNNVSYRTHSTSYYGGYALFLAGIALTTGYIFSSFLFAVGVEGLNTMRYVLHAKLGILGFNYALVKLVMSD